MIFNAIILHIIFGALSLLVGYAVILCPKGKTSHKYLGRIYVVSILVLGLTGTYIALIVNVPISMLNGLVLCYFVLSALNVIYQAPNRTNLFDKLLLVYSSALVIGFVWYSYQTTKVADGKLGGFGIEAYVAFGSVMLFSAIADFRYLLSGGLGGRSRLIRHLWRMFFPLFMSTAAFFLGQSRHLPEALRSIEFLLLPVGFVILSAIYWVLKIKGNKLSLQLEKKMT